mmetsp:Transcript_6992/g.20344  ORF Transcript_6992/g.20344 Transcript_6992/m.20344 type:complete len:84 (+) Transcript_6992:3258-3509(+)
MGGSELFEWERWLKPAVQSLYSSIDSTGRFPSAFQYDITSGSPPAHLALTWRMLYTGACHGTPSRSRGAHTRDSYYCVNDFWH